VVRGLYYVDAARIMRVSPQGLLVHLRKRNDHGIILALPVDEQNIGNVPSTREIFARLEKRNTLKLFLDKQKLDNSPAARFERIKRLVEVLEPELKGKEFHYAPAWAIISTYDKSISYTDVVTFFKRNRKIAERLGIVGVKGRKPNRRPVRDLLEENKNWIIPGQYYVDVARMLLISPLSLYQHMKTDNRFGLSLTPDVEDERFDAAMADEGKNGDDKEFELDDIFEMRSFWPRSAALQWFGMTFVADVVSKTKFGEGKSAAEIFQALKMREEIKEQLKAMGSPVVDYGDFEDWDKRMEALSYLLFGEVLSEDNLINRLDIVGLDDDAVRYYAENSGLVFAVIAELSVAQEMFTFKELLIAFRKEMLKTKKELEGLVAVDPGTGEFVRLESGINVDILTDLDMVYLSRSMNIILGNMPIDNGMTGKDEKLPNEDAAMSDEVGGINLDPSQMQLETTGTASMFDIPLDAESLENINIEGFVPVIFSITPITNLPLIMGSKEEKEVEELSMK